VDTGSTVTVATRLDRVPADSRVASLISRCIAGAATADEAAQFQALWQARVRTLVLEHADDPEIIVLQY